MIYLLSNSKELIESDALRKYFRIKCFECFDDISFYLKQISSDSHRMPMAIISEENLNNISIYQFLEDKELEFKLINTPVVVIKDKLTGNESNYLSETIIDDFIPYDVNHEDLIERIRFLISNKGRINDNKFKSLSRKNKKSITLSLRRIFDIFFCSLFLFAFSPIFLLIAIVIKFESKGPVFYVSYRAGSGYKIFEFYKFRTMVPDADKKLKEYGGLNQYNKNKNDHSTFFKIANDPRVTKFGAFLRKTSLDEVPQLFNVLKGDMSLIGNRPLPLYEAQQLTRDSSAKRFDAPAGITGLWQVSKRGRIDMSEQERIELDIQYAENYNLFQDIEIFFKTIPAIHQKEAV